MIELFSVNSSSAHGADVLALAEPIHPVAPPLK
jgi:hypothetical protein